ncbi:MAG: hypothetical protein OEV40_06870 [Acidimicrobiia bacterium]|nr:hypothetical protein [Acidimicrobiia bacterium]
MNRQQTIDTVPVAFTPPRGWTEWPPPILAGCTEPRADGAPDLDGYWRTVEVLVDGEVALGHPALGHVQRIEQRGDRVVVTGGGIIHDMRCDGTVERGVHDVAEFDKSTEIHVVASYEDGVHVLRPQGMDIEVRRRRDGELLVWDYLGFTARLEHLAPSATDPSAVAALRKDS